MDHHSTIRRGRLSTLDTGARLPALAEIALHLAVVVTQWHRRSETRRALKRLEPHRLDDIGKTRAEAWREAARPFWAD